MPTPLAWAVDLIPLLLSAWLVWRVFETMVGRVGYGFDLEWMEGGMLGHAWQMTHGLPLYPDPEPHHVAFVYPPGYTAVLAGLSEFFGLDYAVGRWVSILSTAAAAAAIAFGARRQGGHWAPGLVGAALFVGLYNASGAFYDMVRPDALAVALLGWALVAGLERHKGAPVLSGMLLVAAFVCKHNLAVFGVPILLHFWLRVSRRAALTFAAASIGPALLMTGVLELLSGGNFLRFILGVPAGHSLNGLRGFPGTQLEVIHWLYPGLLAAAAYLFVRAVPRVTPNALALPLVLAAVLGAWAPGLTDAVGPNLPEEWWIRNLGFGALGLIAGCLVAVSIDTAARREPADRWIVGTTLAAVAVVIASLMRAHLGGFVNVLMPLHWTCCFALAVLAGRARNQWPGLVGIGATATVATVSVLWQIDRVDLDRLVPTPEDQAAGEASLARIAEVCGDGPIYSPFAAWIPVQLGQQPSAHLIGVWDINHERSPFLHSMDTFREVTAERYWTCVLEGGKEALGHGVHEHYQRTEPLPARGPVWMPRTGWRARPNSIYRPKPR